MRCPVCGERMNDGLYFLEEDGQEDEHGYFCCPASVCFTWMVNHTDAARKAWSRILNYCKYDVTSWTESATRSAHLVKIFTPVVVSSETNTVPVKRERTRTPVKKKVKRKRKRTRTPTTQTTSLEEKIADLGVTLTRLTEAVESIQRSVELLANKEM